jgi:hypothetical protein
LPNKAYIDFNVSELLRGDFATRVAGYSSALQAGWMTINEVRKIEDFKPVTDGDTNRVPLANVNLQSASLTEQQSKIEMLGAMVRAGFDPNESASALGLPPVHHLGVPPVTLQAVKDPAVEQLLNETPTTKTEPSAIVALTQEGL